MPRHNVSGEQKHLIQVTQGQKSTILVGENQLLPPKKGTCVWQSYPESPLSKFLLHMPGRAEIT